jgi:hypothetical protein
MGYVFYYTRYICIYKSFNSRSYFHRWFCGEKEHWNVSQFLSIRGGGGGGERGRREVQNDIKPMMNPIELPLLNQTISNPGISTTPNDPSNELVQTLWSMDAPLRYVVPSNSPH